MRKSTADLAAGLFTLAVAGVFHHQSQELEGISLLFPQMLIIFLTLGGLFCVAAGLLKRRSGNDEVTDAEPVAVGRVAQIGAGSIGYVAVVPFLGFYPATIVFLFSMGMLLNDASQSTRKTAMAAGLFTVVLCLLVWLGFAVLLGVPTPQSVFFE